jgi:hypothetical protein
MQNYDQAIERQMANCYGSLSEKDRRRYAAVEAAKLGHGGIAYIRAAHAHAAQARVLQSLPARTDRR